MEVITDKNGLTVFAIIFTNLTGNKKKVDLIHQLRFTTFSIFQISTVLPNKGKRERENQIKFTNFHFYKLQSMGLSTRK